MVTVRLSNGELSFLREQLERQAEHLDSELIHTDRREMQRELARDVARLRAVIWNLEHARDRS